MCKDLGSILRNMRRRDGNFCFFQLLSETNEVLIAICLFFHLNWFITMMGKRGKFLLIYSHDQKEI